jgi:outer membrane lipopolysaccharide assembly protein LptE/RlpB
MPRLPLIRRPLRTAWLLAAALALFAGGCGFQPRGQSAGAAGIPAPLFISGISPYSALHRELEEQLRIAGVALSPSAAESAAVLSIGDWRHESRLLSVNSRNKAVEFELEESAQFGLRARDGAELVADQTARSTRIQFRPETAVLGSSREAELLRADMISDLAQRIVRRLAAGR